MRYILLSLLVSMTTFAQIQLTENGAPRAAILLDPGPTRSAQLGAHELQHHIQAITGARLPIQTVGDALPEGHLPIYIGESAPTREMGLLSHHFAPHESLVRLQADALVFIGHDDADFGEVDYEGVGTWPGFNLANCYYRVGSLYAVYDFLERQCGVRWYMPSPVGAVIPKTPTLSVEAVVYRQRPWTAHRQLGRGSWGKLGDPGEPDLAGVNRYKHYTPARDSNLYALRTRRASEPFGVNHSFYDYYERFGETHPEWFVRGKPGPDVQLRYDNPEVIEQVVKDAGAYFDLPYPERRWGAQLTQAMKMAKGDFFPFYPLDNRDYGENLQPPEQPERQGRGFGSGVSSNYIFTAVSNVARAISDTYPEAKISTLAYAGTFQPPEFDLPPNVAVNVAMSDGWAEDSYGWETLLEWRRRCSRIYTWEYHYARGFPAIRPHKVADYVKRLHALRIDGMFMEIGDKNPALAHLDYYVTAKFLVDAEQDIEAILDHYYRTFYGPAEAPMRTFWETLEAARAESDEKNLRGSTSWAIVGSEARIGTLQSVLAEAEQLATAEPYATRLGYLRTAVLEPIVETSAFHRRAHAAPIPEMTASRTQGTINVDGKLDEAVWQDATQTPPFVSMLNETPAVETYGLVTWDSENLYIGLRCAEPNMDQLKAHYTDSTSHICTDDSIEVNIDPTPDTKDYIQIMLNVNSQVWTWWRIKHRPQTSPDLGIRGAVARHADSWTAEIVVPLAAITESPPQPGDTWQLNLMRNRFAFSTKNRFDQEHWHCWSPPFMWSWHVKERFGSLHFAN